MSHLMDAINLTLSRDLGESQLVGSKNFMKQPTTAKTQTNGFVPASIL